MGFVSPVDVLAVLGPISAVVLHEAVRTRVTLAELHEAVRLVRYGDEADPAVYGALEARMRRLVDLVSVVIERQEVGGKPGKSAATSETRLLF
ncbi:hypothetical protein FPY71_12240 [Aureimonas fodinaquatilis]|uniref:Uncharacterized protein n=1 Tax=Aureimonas fodinaquatilis TaxID=2565783 RepID=A0A5B0DTM0_9HYPH|nr:hypothetical protein [Aureimonas fodinaquatilis]KAA0969322.1 hypothetical protein FPY71_12240 [Aureimonas fodinaquatilis]